MTERAAGTRFTVRISAKALQEASAAGANLPRLVNQSLDHINTLLPGPPETVDVSYGTGNELILQTGTAGVTSAATGTIHVAFGPTPQASTGKALQHLPRALAHETDHIVRASATGGGYILTLLDQIISEGISSVFDEAALPGPPNPWDQAISKTQECVLWNKAQPLLGESDLYDQWFFGGGDVPHWTGFTIGYHIVSDYHRRHPQASWPALTAAPVIAHIMHERNRRQAECSLGRRGSVRLAGWLHHG